MPGIAGEERAAPALGQCRERLFTQVLVETDIWHNAPSASWAPPASPVLVATCLDAQELRSRRRGASCQLVPNPTVSPEGLTTALVILDPGCF